jgi:hypothetical protein
MPFDYSFPGLRTDSMSIPLVTFLGVLAAYPQAAVEITVRNYNTIEPASEGEDQHRMSVELLVYLPEERQRGDWHRNPSVWTERVNLSRILPPKVMDLLRSERLDDRPMIPWYAFLLYGQVIADTLNRQIDISHQQGGNMEYASYTIYGPFLPGMIGPVQVRGEIGPAFLG